MQQRTWRRRNYFVRKEFQGRFVLRFFLTILIGAIVFTAIFSLFSSHTITVTYEGSVLRIDRTPKALFVEILRAYGVYIFLLGLGISIFSLLLSHRIAGPLYRLEKSVEEIAKGNLAFKITLRRKDELKELAALMNSMIRELSGRVRDMKEKADLVEGAIHSLSESSEDEKVVGPEIRKGVSEAVKSMEDFKKTLSFFKLHKD